MSMSLYLTKLNKNWQGGIDYTNIWKEMLMIVMSTKHKLFLTKTDSNEEFLVNLRSLLENSRYFVWQCFNQALPTYPIHDILIAPEDIQLSVYEATAI